MSQLSGALISLSINRSILTQCRGSKSLDRFALLLFFSSPSSTISATSSLSVGSINNFIFLSLARSPITLYQIDNNGTFDLCLVDAFFLLLLHRISRADYDNLQIIFFPFLFGVLSKNDSPITRLGLGPMDVDNCPSLGRESNLFKGLFHGSSSPPPHARNRFIVYLHSASATVKLSRLPSLDVFFFLI